MSGNFFDSNILLYAASFDEPKASVVDDLLGRGGTISVQVLNEVANVARRKFRMSWADARTFLATMQDLLTIVPVVISTHQNGLRLAERYGFAIYDAMIVAAALEAGCDTLWSEDMQHGLLIDGRLRISNPFRASLAP